MVYVSICLFIPFSIWFSDFVELKILADPDVSVKNKNNAFNKVVGRLTKKGKTLTRTAAALIKKVKTLDVNDPVGVKNVLDKINKVLTDADTKQKIDKAKSLQNKISKQTKKSVGLGKPISISGLNEDSRSAGFAASIGALIHVSRIEENDPADRQTRTLPHGPFERIGAWLRDNL